MAKEVVDQQDAITAIFLVDAARLDWSLIDMNPMLDLSSLDPDADFDLQAETILEMLQIDGHWGLVQNSSYALLESLSEPLV